jgi:hypothetical protein
MTPTEIADALSEISRAPFDPAEFGFSFAEATDNAPATVAKLRNGSYNRSDIQGGVLLNKKFHFAPAAPGFLDATLDALRMSKATGKNKPVVLIACDGELVSAEHVASGETRHFPWAELGNHFGFFLTAAGKERYQAADENPIDVKVSGKLAKLYDALIKRNPEWSTPERRHDMNQLMTRLIFCLFAEDVGIFPADQFSRLVFTHSGDKGEDLDTALRQAFTAMNRPKGQRDGLPAWTHEFEYVNGGLFAGTIDAPVFDAVATRYLKEAAGENWREINPDIFGSMIQSVADPKLRSVLGMHYTSVPNILKVLGPLFLDEIDTEIEKAWDRPNALRKVIDRLAKIRVFDPACGSGNFLVVAYREMRDRETRIMSRLAELDGGAQVEMWSRIPITHFYGIELTDFGAETAKLALFIAEYQANARMADVFGRKAAALPLRAAANVVCDNALRVDWEEVCPVPEDGGEVFIAGNPPFYGKAQQDDDQKEDKNIVFSAVTKSYKAFDYVVSWFYKAGQYIEGRPARAAFVATNSIVQGAAASTVWPLVLGEGREIFFAHRTLKWRNNAKDVAAVMFVIVGLRNRSSEPKTLIDGDLGSTAANINVYLLDAPDVVVTPAGSSIFGLPEMLFGNMPRDGGHLILDDQDRITLIDDGFGEFVKNYMGSEEVVKGFNRHCLWIPEGRQDDARRHPIIASRLESVAEMRRASDASSTRDFAARPYRFVQIQGVAQQSAILVPRVSSERRPYLPFDRVGADTISSDLNQVLYDAPDWCMSLIGSRLHLVWIGTVCGRLESRFRYSNTLGWNTFPVPRFTETQLEALSASARKILRTRYGHFPKTIADLYDPEKMPEDLRQAHKENDDLLESMYIGRPFRNDTERLEHLFKLYAARVRQIEKEEAAVKASKKASKKNGHIGSDTASGSANQGLL